MHPSPRSLLLAITALLLTGCGQAGTLKLPSQQPSAGPEASAQQDRAERKASEDAPPDASSKP